MAATFYHLISGQAPPNSQSRVSEIAMKNPDPCVPLAGCFPEYDDVFLEAIDMAMRISPQDRIQSAREWVQMIDPSNTHVENYVRPVVNKGLGMTLTSLVKDTNEGLLTIPPSPLKMTPLETLQANTNMDVADWVKEFNEETLASSDSSESKGSISEKMASRFGSPDSIPLEVPRSKAEDAELFGEPPKKKFNFKLVLAVLGVLGALFAALNNPSIVMSLLGQ